MDDRSAAQTRSQLPLMEPVQCHHCSLTMHLDHRSNSCSSTRSSVNGSPQATLQLNVPALTGTYSHKHAAFDNSKQLT